MDEVSPWIIRAMALFRFIVVTLICILLLSPLVRTISRQVEKPIVIIAQDNSESLVLSKDSSYYRKEYKEALSKLAEELAEKYEIRTYTFGDKISEGLNMLFSEKQTDMSGLFEEIQSRYAHRNVGAVVIASDGLYNKGSNPIYSSQKLKLPIYTIALGDTTVRKDISIAKVEHNRLAYLGNTFPLQIVVNATELKGKSSLLTVSKGNATVFSQKIDVNSNTFSTTVAIQLDAKETGLQRYRVKVAELEEEFNTRNNVRDVFIDVLDNRQKILILAEAPHPDVAAIRQSLESSQAYEVESYTIDDFDKPLKQYSLVILHRLPNPGMGKAPVLTELNNSDIPVLSFSGANAIVRGDLEGSTFSSKMNESEPVLAEAFPLFTISENLRKSIADYPAVTCPFGTYEQGNGDNVLLYQRIGVVNTKSPLLSFSQTGGAKVAVFAGEGLWKWRLNDYAVNKNQDAFNELISKTVQYLAVKVDKSFFRVSMAKNNLFENEPVEFNAEVYNDSYELVNDVDVSLEIINAEGKRFPFTFSKTGNAYRLEAGIFPAGDYRYEAGTKIGQKVYKARGEFSITALHLEAAATVADHQLLFQLAQKNGGQMVYPNGLKDLSMLLSKRDDIKPVVYTEKKLDDVINLKWLFFLFLALLAAEWFLRKRNGAY